MRFGWLMVVGLASGCSHRGPTHASAPPSDALLGTWRGALEADPITLRVFGTTSRGMRAEMQVDYADGAEQWTLYGLRDDADEITFEHQDGLPACRATIEDGRMFGNCKVTAGRALRQWLVVQL